MKRLLNYITLLIPILWLTGLCYASQRLCLYIPLAQKWRNAKVLSGLEKHFPFKKYPQHHISLVYITLNDNRSQQEVGAMASDIKNYCQKLLPQEGIMLKGKKLSWWKKLFVAEYESKEFCTYHAQLAQSVKKKFSDVGVEYAGRSIPHVTLGRSVDDQNPQQNSDNVAHQLPDSLKYFVIKPEDPIVCVLRVNKKRIELS